MLEVPFQLDKLKEWDRLHDYIATRQYLVHAMAFDEVEIATYWRHLFEAMPDKVALKDYLSVCPDEPEKASEFYTILLRLCKVLFKVNSKTLFLKQFESLINQHPELATAKAYRTLAVNVNGPEDGKSAEEALGSGRSARSDQRQAGVYLRGNRTCCCRRLPRMEQRGWDSCRETAEAAEEGFAPR